jgi:hypothetical protein
MFKDRKGMEFAIGTFVGIILGVLMLIAGVALVTNIINKTNDAQDEISVQMEQDIIDAFRGNDLVYVHKNQVSPNSDSRAIFGIGILNIYSDTRDFKLNVESDTFNSIMFTKENISIAPREKFVTFIIVSTEDIDGGQHSLKLEVEHYNGTTWLPHGKPKLLYVVK